jgi:hypothetical protein
MTRGDSLLDGDFLIATGSGVYPAFCPMGYGEYFPGDKEAGAASHSHLVVLLMHKAIPSLRYTSSWC